MSTLAEAEAEIAEMVRDLEQKYLQLGYEVADLPTVMRPWLRRVAEIRAHHLARLGLLDRSYNHVASIH